MVFAKKCKGSESAASSAWTPTFRLVHLQLSDPFRRAREWAECLGARSNCTVSGQITILHKLKKEQQGFPRNQGTFIIRDLVSPKKCVPSKSTHAHTPYQHGVLKEPHSCGRTLPPRGTATGFRGRQLLLPEVPPPSKGPSKFVNLLSPFGFSSGPKRHEADRQNNGFPKSGFPPRNLGEMSTETPMPAAWAQH